MADSGGSRPLMDDPSVKEFLSLLEAHSPPGKNDTLALFRQIAGMEKQLNSAVNELAAMRKELAEVREGPVKRTLTKAVKALEQSVSALKECLDGLKTSVIDGCKRAVEELAAMRKELAEVREGPVKRTLTKAVKALEQSVSALKERLDGLKTSVIDGCKRAVEAVRECGASALAHTARFFRVRPALEAIGREADRAAARSDKAITTIREVGANYHDAGRSLKNAGRVLLGREPIAEVKGPGKLAHALESSCKLEKSAFTALKRGAVRALDKLSRLEHPQERKPPIRQTMRELNKKIAREQRERPVPAIEHEGR